MDELVSGMSIYGVSDTLRPRLLDTGELEGVFNVALERVAQNPAKAETYIRHAQDLLESLGAVNSTSEEKRSA